MNAEPIRSLTDDERADLATIAKNLRGLASVIETAPSDGTSNLPPSYAVAWATTRMKEISRDLNRAVVS